MSGKSRQLLQNGFLRSVSVLVGGTAFGQAVSIAVLPLLTRLYTPEDFSLLAVYAGLLGILGLVACLRFEIAISLPESRHEAANLLVLSLAISVGLASLLALPCLFSPDWVARVLHQPAIEPYLLFVPLGVLMMGTYNALQFWATRNKEFHLIARTRMTQSVGGAGTQLGFGWAGITPIGLIVGQLVSSGAGALGLGWKTLRELKRHRDKISLTEMGRLARVYDRYPKYSSLEAFSNNAGIQIPVLMIAAAAGPEAGYLALAMRVMQAPMGLVGGAIAQVYLSRAPEEHRAGNLAGFTTNILGGLLKSGVGPLAFAGIVSPVVFSLVFGKEWGRAGDLVAWMTPWFICQFLASPISMALHVTGHQRIALGLQVFGLVLRVGFVAGAVAVQSAMVAEVYALTGLAFYFAYILLVLKVVGCRQAELLAQFRSGLLFILPWIVGGVLFNFFLGKLVNGIY